jgi:hypothetical protein
LYHGLVKQQDEISANLQTPTVIIPKYASKHPFSTQHHFGWLNRRHLLAYKGHTVKFVVYTHFWLLLYFLSLLHFPDRLLVRVIRDPGYRSRDPGFVSRRYQMLLEVVGLERGSLSLVSITAELIQWKCSGSESRKPRLTTVGIRCADHATPSNRESWH